jgi:hypothetical protein
VSCVAIGRIPTPDCASGPATETRIPTRSRSSGPSILNARQSRLAGTSLGTNRSSQMIESSSRVRLIERNASPFAHSGTASAAASLQTASRSGKTINYNCGGFMGSAPSHQTWPSASRFPILAASTVFVVSTATSSQDGHVQRLSDVARNLTQRSRQNAAVCGFRFLCAPGATTA